METGIMIYFKKGKISSRYLITKAKKNPSGNTFRPYVYKVNKTTKKESFKTVLENCFFFQEKNLKKKRRTNKAYCKKCKYYSVCDSLDYKVSTAEKKEQIIKAYKKYFNPKYCTINSQIDKIVFKGSVVEKIEKVDFVFDRSDVKISNIVVLEEIKKCVSLKKKPINK